VNDTKRLEMAVLINLEDGNELTFKQVAHKMIKTPNYMISKTLKALVDAGFASQRSGRAKFERRNMFYTLTPRGIEFYDYIARRMQTLNLNVDDLLRGEKFEKI